MKKTIEVLFAKMTPSQKLFYEYNEKVEQYENALLLMSPKIIDAVFVVLNDPDSYVHKQIEGRKEFLDAIKALHDSMLNGVSFSNLSDPIYLQLIIQKLFFNIETLNDDDNLTDFSGLNLTARMEIARILKIWKMLYDSTSNISELEFILTHKDHHLPDSNSLDHKKRYLTKERIEMHEWEKVVNTN